MNESVLAELVNISEEAILIINQQGYIKFANNRAKQIFYPSLDLTERNIKNMLDPHTLTNIKEAVEELQDNYPETCFDIPDYEGLRSYVSKICVRKLPEVKYYLVTALGVTKKQQQSAYQLYKLLAENAYDINLMFAGDSIIYLSPSVYDFLGFRADAFKTMDDWYNLIHPDDDFEIRKQLSHPPGQHNAENVIIYRQQHSNGDFLWFEGKLKQEKREDGSVVNLLTSMDITQRKMAEEQIDRQKKFMEELFDTDPNLIYVKNAEGRIIYCNKAFADLLGLTREAVLEHPEGLLPFATEPNQNIQEIEAKVLEEGHDILIEEKVEDANNITNYFQTLKKPLRNYNGEVLLLSISTNINKIKYYQNERNKAMKAKEEFFSSMSHEIRTPMNAIIGLTDLLLKRNPRQDQAKLMQTLHFSSKNLLSLINDVLDFSKIEAGKVELESINFNLKDFIDNIYLSLKPRALSKNLTLGLKFDEQVPEIVRGDSVKLSQVLNNLVGNAIKFTEEGNVTLGVSLIEHIENGCRIQFSIKDTGIGIPEDKMQYIFDPFHQASNSISRKYGGTGLGLSIVKNLVELQNGKVNVKSKDGVGTTFSVILPFAYPDGQETEDILHEEDNSHSITKLNISVLYVEDVATNQYLIQEILNDWGIKVDLASDGYEAINKIKQFKYDLVLMDIQMPGMDGYETAVNIRTLDGEYFDTIPIIALTASSSEAVKKAIAQSGMQDFVQKPVNSSHLRRALIKYTALDDQDKLDLLEETSEQSGSIISSVDFEKTDKLFLNNIIRYQDFLKKTIEEFDVSKDELCYSIETRNLDQFRQVHHRMKSLIATLGLHDLASLIKGIKRQMKEAPEALKTEDEVQSLKQQVNHVKDNLTNKLSSLKWH